MLKYLQNHRGTNYTQGMSFEKICGKKSLAPPPASVVKVAISSHIYATKIPAVPVPFLSSLSFSALSQKHLLPKEQFILERRLC